MAKPTIKPSSGNFLKRWFGTTHIDAPDQLSQLDAGDAITDGLTISMLLGNYKKPGRNRQQIYWKWMEMTADPIVSTALRLHVTAALGGHETSGDVVFLEDNAEFKKDKQKMKMVDEIRRDLSPIFNRIAMTVGFNGAGFGDAYGRVYTNGKNGVVDVYVDELVHPSLITPYERGNVTVGYVLATGARSLERLNIEQMVRMKMPRTVYLPQIRAVEKAIRLALTQDDINQLPNIPAVIGGSFLDGAEGPYDSLSSALVGLVGQRVLDSIDENMMTINMDSMTKEQRTEYMGNLKRILKASKDRAEQAVASGKPVLSRMFHLLPVFGEKQLTAISGSIAGANGRGQSGSISIEDVMFHAKMLAGALGIDLSMLGFADLLSGGLGDGGFFRTSAQAAERSRAIRIGLSDFFNQIINIHTFHKYGVIFNPSERPWVVNFYGTISALEGERQKTRSEAMNTGAMLVQTLQQLKDMGLDREATTEILTKIMLLDEAQAEIIVNGMPKPEAEAPDDGGGGFGGGGFGGGAPGGKKPPQLEE